MYLGNVSKSWENAEDVMKLIRRWPKEIDEEQFNAILDQVVQKNPEQEYGISGV